MQGGEDEEGKGRGEEGGEERGLGYGDLENFINTHVGISFVYKLSVAFLTATVSGVGSQRGGGVEEEKEEEGCRYTGGCFA